MEDKIKQLFADVLQVSPDEISEATSPDTLEKWDSLNHLNLVAAFEEEFSIDIEPEEIQAMMAGYLKFKSIILDKTS